MRTALHAGAEHGPEHGPDRVPGRKWRHGQYAAAERDAGEVRVVEDDVQTESGTHTDPRDQR